MASAEHARRLTLALPGTAEQDHHGRPSFRVRGKIFATVPDGDHLNVMTAEADIRAAVSEEPGACEELLWGGRLRAVRVDLREVTLPLLAELLADAWRRKAPASLVRVLDEGGRG
jgi:hypothetical protein